MSYKDENIEDIKHRYPTFPEDMLRRIYSGDPCGVYIGQEWVEDVIELDRKLAEINPDYRIHQIKEKFGSLCYYCEGVGEEGDKLIRELEDRLKC